MVSCVDILLLPDTVEKRDHSIHRETTSRTDTLTCGFSGIQQY